MDKQGRFARVILNGFYAYFAEFENITLAARTRFEQAEWAIMQDFSSRRIDVYKETVMETLEVAATSPATRSRTLILGGHA
ncbi:MAG: hypothetical protein CM15mP74_19640 [Halieaceae bacterium]|nr:MAG: hypothetical protein CM15mP74_19640 [Halieaceae bacterium]